MSKNYNFVIVVVEGWEFVRSLDAVAVAGKDAM